VFRLCVECSVRNPFGQPARQLAENLEYMAAWPPTGASHDETSQILAWPGPQHTGGGGGRARRLAARRGMGWRSALAVAARCGG
jgi:alkanesulfonate monooxygenase SsuD/methylene tetrahydromethanopterin reductase-like flavin-dependent oxidoreductase (luciferase family)